MMKKLLHATLLVTLTTCTATVYSETNAPDLPEFWDDPRFVEEFLGSYGFLSGYEPEISEEERGALRDLVELINHNREAAIKQLESQITDESSAAFDFILGNLHFQSGNLNRAEENYQNAIDKHPDFRRAYKNLGLVQVQNQDFEDAIKTISKALELGVVDGRAYGLLGYSYLTQGSYYPAETAYRKAILMQPEIKDWKVGLARTLLETERYDDAAALFDILIKEDPENPDYWLLQGNAYIGKDQPLRAAENIEVVRRITDPDFSTLNLLGNIYMNEGAADLALEAYLEAADQAGPNEARPLIRASELLIQTGNNKQATAMIERIQSSLEDDLDEDESLKLLTLKAKIARAEGDDEKAVETLERIVERDTLNGEALIELGDYHAEQGNLAKAVNRYEQAQKIDEYEREALVAHARALVNERQYKKALPLLRSALSIRSDENLQDYTDRVERASRNQP
ncbi:MAG: tetratricopeptide repeat protein [Opitutales bacterium]